MTSVQCVQQELEAEAIHILTRAAQAATREGSLQDFAGFVARVLASTAANVGGLQRLHPGPPETPAARQVYALLCGTVGDDLGEWLPHRTQPVIISLNVAQVVEGGLHPDLLGLAAAIDRVAERCTRGEGPSTLVAGQAAIDAVVAWYRDEYRSYADRFVVAAEAAGMERGLRVGVHVTADTNPFSAWSSKTALTNPRDGSADQVAYTLWELAHDATRPPHVALAGAPTADASPRSKGSDHGST